MSNVLGNMLDRLSEQNRWFRDFTFEALARAVRETIACFPGLPNLSRARAAGAVRKIEQMIERAIASAKRRNPAMEESVFNFLRDILLLRFPENLEEEAREAHTHFVLKFQQTTGPMMAKGLEDTAFYIYNRLAALNEVGGEPQQFGIASMTFHERNLERQRDWPATLLATSTHDTKRSEDVRRGCSRFPRCRSFGAVSLQRWRAVNRRWKRKLDEAAAPDRKRRISVLPNVARNMADANVRRTGTGARRRYIERIQAYMAKALKEAKVNTSWIQPNEAVGYGDERFRRQGSRPIAPKEISPIFLPVARRNRPARRNQFADTEAVETDLPACRIFIRATKSGISAWSIRITGSPVDYKRRREMLESLSEANPQELMENWPDGTNQTVSDSTRSEFSAGHARFVPARRIFAKLAANGTLADCCVASAERGTR